MDAALSRPFNLILFNLAWAGCVLGRDSLLWLTAPLVIGYVLVLLGATKLKPYQVFLPAGVGIAADSILTLLGIFQFENAGPIIPLWLIILWFMFATTLSGSLKPLGNNKIIVAITGAIAMPFNYSIGAQLGAVSFPFSYLISLAAIGLIWSIGLPVLFTLANNFRWTLSDQG